MTKREAVFAKWGGGLLFLLLFYANSFRFAARTFKQLKCFVFYIIKFSLLGGMSVPCDLKLGDGDKFWPDVA